MKISDAQVNNAQPTQKTSEVQSVALSDVPLTVSTEGVPREYKMRLLKDLESVQSQGPAAQNILLRFAVEKFNRASTGQTRRKAEEEIRLVLRAQTSKAEAKPNKKDDDSWIDDLHRAPGHRVRSGSWNELFRELGIESDSEQAQSLRRLVSALGGGAQGQGMSIGYLRELADQHGKQKLFAVAGKLLSYLNEMRGKEPPEGIDPIEIAKNALRDVALPSAIGQGSGAGGKGTCAAASIQGKLAAERPEQYVDMLLTLAKGETYRAPGGKRIRPNDTWKGDGQDNRRLSEKIMQNAIMNLRGESYNSKEKNGGMTRGQSETAAQDVFGYNWNEFDSEEPGLLTSKQDMWDYIKDDLARGRPVSISFEGHALLVVGFDPTKRPQEVLISTWGSIHTMNLDDFLNHLKAVRHVDDPGRDNRDIPNNRRTQVVDG